MINAAIQYLSEGISIVSTDLNKRATIPWKPFQTTLATKEQVSAMYSNKNAVGIATICGAVSGNLEAIDIDCKYDLTGSLFEDYMQKVVDALPELAGNLRIVKTKGGGYHILYRCPIIGGNQKLAQRPSTPEEVTRNPNEKVLVLIETRSEGGYIVAPPTTGYTVLQDKPIPEITPDQRDLLLTAARSMNLYIVEMQKPLAAASGVSTYALTPWEDYNGRGIDDMLERLEKHGWTVVTSNSKKIVFKRPGNSESISSGDYNYELNLFSVFTTSSIFEPLKGYRPAAVFTMLECNADYRAGALKLAENGYGTPRAIHGAKLEREVFKKKMDGENKEGLLKYIQAKHNKSEQDAEQVLSDLEKQWGEKICTFWDIDKNGCPKVNYTRFINFLHVTGGFGLYFHAKSRVYRVVKMEDGFIEESDPEQMKKYIVKYISSLPDSFDGGITRDDLYEVVIRGNTQLFADNLMEFLPQVHPDFLRDTKHLSFFPFQNGVVIVDKAGFRVTSYKDINKVIWKSQVIDFNIDIAPDNKPEYVEIHRFIECICDKDMNRVMYAMQIIGYLLHRYKDPGRPWAVVLGEETEEEAKGGGTGKGIFAKMLMKIINTVTVDGKNYKPDKNFLWQRVALDTKLIVIEDVDRRFDFEKLYSIITEGITVEKKNKDELYIPYEDSPKVLITTNFTISTKGNHAQRRQKLLEFSSYFSPKNTPEMFFGHKLYDDWDLDEWNRFYNYLFACLQLYLDNGVSDLSASVSNKRKYIKLNYGEEFIDWFEIQNGTLKNWQPFKELYDGFLKNAEMDKKEYSKKRFKSALVEICQKFDHELQEQRNRQNNNQHEFKIEYAAGFNDEHKHLQLTGNTVLD